MKRLITTAAAGIVICLNLTADGNPPAQQQVMIVRDADSSPGIPRMITERCFEIPDTSDGVKYELTIKTLAKPTLQNIVKHLSELVTSEQATDDTETP